MYPPWEGISPPTFSPLVSNTLQIRSPPPHVLYCRGNLNFIMHQNLYFVRKFPKVPTVGRGSFPLVSNQYLTTETVSPSPLVLRAYTLHLELEMYVNLNFKMHPKLGFSTQRAQRGRGIPLLHPPPLPASVVSHTPLHLRFYLSSLLSPPPPHPCATKKALPKHAYYRLRAKKLCPPPPQQKWSRTPMFTTVLLCTCHHIRAKMYVSI